MALFKNVYYEITLYKFGLFHMKIMFSEGQILHENVPFFMSNYFWCFLKYFWWHFLPNLKRLCLYRNLESAPSVKKLWWSLGKTMQIQRSCLILYIQRHVHINIGKSDIYIICMPILMILFPFQCIIDLVFHVESLYVLFSVFSISARFFWGTPIVENSIVAYFVRAKAYTITRYMT